MGDESPEAQMSQFDMRRSTSLSDDQGLRGAKIFGVDTGDITLSPHPMNHDRMALTVRFFYGVNVAAALATFLNSEFYTVQKYEYEDRFYKPNPYAFIGTVRGDETLTLTITGSIDTFLDGLQTYQPDIKFVLENPKILFLMRPNIDFKTARSNLQAGFQPDL